MATSEAATVLVVAHDPDLGAVLVRRLSGPDVTVDLALDPRDALVALRGAAPDLVVIELNEGAASAYSLLERVRTEAPRTAVVALGSLRAGSGGSRARAHGATTYVSKASDPRTVLAAIRGILDRVRIAAREAPGTA